MPTVVQEELTAYLRLHTHMRYGNAALLAVLRLPVGAAVGILAASEMQRRLLFTETAEKLAPWLAMMNVRAGVMTLHDGAIVHFKCAEIEQVRGVQYELLLLQGVW